MESALVNLVLPVFKLCRWAMYTSYSIERNRQGSFVVCSTGSIVRKALVTLFQVIILIKIVALSFRNEALFEGDKKIMYRFVAFTYLFYNLSEFWTLNSKMRNIDKLFMRIENLERDLVSRGAQMPSARKMKMAAWTMVTSWMLFAIAFAFGTRVGGVGSLFTDGFSKWAEEAAGTAVLEAELLLRINSTIFVPRHHSTIMNVAVASPLILFSILYKLHWFMGFLMLLMWGLVFDKIFQSFFRLFEKKAGCCDNVVQEIKKFHEILFAIDSFNEIFSKMIFGAVLSGGSHFSVYLMTVFQSESSVVDETFTIICFMIFWAQLLAAAEVGRSAGSMKKMLRTRFHSDETWGEGIVSDPRTTHALIILSSDLSNGNVGFEGWGYFTITYSLIGSVLSLIVTYAIVALQMN